MGRARLAFALLALVPVLAVAAAGADRLSRARTLHEDVQEHLDDPSLERRQRAMFQLREAIDLDPKGEAGNHWRLLGYVQELGGYDAMAAQSYRTALVQAPKDGEIWQGLARVRKRQYLRELDPADLNVTLAVLDTASRCFPPSSLPWTAMVPLLLERGDLARAAEAAEKGLDGHPRTAEGVLAAAVTAWRTGAIERADSLFRVALPRLAPDVHALFDRPQVTLGLPRAPRPTVRNGLVPLPAGRAPRLEEAFPDPDPTTPQNEVLLEYWARVAHAVLLFNDAIRPGLDARTDTYIRYGPPARILYNPVGMDLEFDPEPTGGGNRRDGGRTPTANKVPLHAQVWLYPELNMRIVLHDRSLLGKWTIPAVREPLPNSTPDPAALARRQDLLGVRGGFAVFPTLPGGGLRVDARMTLVGFEGENGPRLSAFVGAAGDSLRATWLVTDAAGRTFAKGAQAMGRSLCGPGRSAGAFDAPVPPGRYDVVVSLRGPGGRRGLVRDSVTIAPVMDAMAMTDLVRSCGQPALLVDRDAIRLEPAASDTVRGRDPLTIYFELYHLDAGPDGLSRYRFDYRVERLGSPGKGRRQVSTGAVSTWASRDEVYRGRVRRQFISLPVSELPPARYRLIVTVHDLVSGASDGRSLEFERR